MKKGIVYLVAAVALIGCSREGNKTGMSEVTNEAAGAEHQLKTNLENGTNLLTNMDKLTNMLAPTNPPPEHP